MEKYENLGMVGEGSYGLVMKCRHRESGQVVAIKKFLENEDDLTVKKIALREVRMLKKLRHENLVNLIEVFRRRRRLYLVFEFVDHTILDELEQHPSGLDEDKVRQHTWQILRGLDFCHSQNIIHRDIKPENVLVSRLGVIKLCDFGFARILADPSESHTDYVATRWYRAPELLVGDTKYGKEVDIWALGCLFAEMLTGDPIFPGESDIDQIFYITNFLGPLSNKHQELMIKNPMFSGMKLKSDEESTVAQKLSNTSSLSSEFIKLCLKLNPTERAATTQLLNHQYFHWDSFSDKFIYELKHRIQQEFRSNPLLKKYIQHNTLLSSSSSSKKQASFNSDDIWKNRHYKQLINKGPSPDDIKLRFKPPEVEIVAIKSSTVSSSNNSNKIQLTPPKVIPTKIAPLVSKAKNPSPKADQPSISGSKDLGLTTIPPIGSGHSPELIADFRVPSSGLTLVGVGNASSPDSTRFLSWFPEKAKRSSTMQKKVLNQNSFSTVPTNNNLVNSLLQGERSRLHDKVLLSKRKQKYEHLSSKVQNLNEDLSLPDVPGASGSPTRIARSYRKAMLTPMMPSLGNYDNNATSGNASSPTPPPHGQLGSGFLLQPEWKTLH